MNNHPAQARIFLPARPPDLKTKPNGLFQRALWRSRRLPVRLDPGRKMPPSAAANLYRSSAFLSVGTRRALRLHRRRVMLCRFRINLTRRDLPADRAPSRPARVGYICPGGR